MPPKRKRGNKQVGDFIETDIIDSFNRRYQSPDADFTLISSDGLRFKVQKVHLRAASPVFNAMFGVGDKTDNKLRLTDGDIETASIVAPMLDLIHGKAICMSRTGSIGFRLYRVVRVLQKYECDAALTIVRLQIRNEAVTGKSSAMHLFEAAVCLNDVESSRALIHRCASWLSYAHPGGDFGEPLILYKSCMDPLTWDPLTFSRIPARELRALLQAIAKGRTVKGEIDWVHVADEYQRILQVSNT